MFILGLAATLLAIAWLLESLELEPRPGRRRADAPAPALALGTPALRPSLVPAAGLAVRIDEFVRGEPIAARRDPRPTPAVLTRAPRAPATSSSVRAGGNPRRRSGDVAEASVAGFVTAEALDPAQPAVATRAASLPLSAPRLVSAPQLDALPRPNVRTQLERSRQVRARRATWLLGGRGPID